jgi:CysZ protein
MMGILRAAVRAFYSLLQPGVLWHLVWPVVVSVVGWVTLGVMYIDKVVDVLLVNLQGFDWLAHWLNGGFAYGAASGVLQVLVWLFLIPLSFATALFVIAVLGLPMMLDRVAELEYADLQRRGGGSVMGSLFNALGALAVFLFLLLVSLPVWLVPGGGLVVSVLLPAWLNRRCFSYDALMKHADAEELRRLPREHRNALNGIAVASAALSWVPLLNLLVPAWSGLTFVHYLLGALRDERARPFRGVADVLDA